MTENPTIRIKIIGCGGIGGHLARNLCHFLHAERRAAHVVLVDGDAFEERNRNRMRFTRFENKAVAMARELAQSFGGGALTVEPLPEYVTPENVETIVEEGDLVFLAVDNHATRRVVGAACAARQTVTLLSGGNDGVEDASEGTYGNVQIVRRENGRDCTSPLDRYHPEITEARDKLPTERGCAEQAEAGAPQLLFTNLAVASAALNAFYGLLSGRAGYEEVYLDILKNRMTPVVRAPVASDRPA